MEKNKIIVTLFFGGICTVLVMLYVFNPVQIPFFPRCLFRQLTGLSCPGCGLQRAIHALLHGRFAEAASYNYWLLFSLPYFIVLLVMQFFSGNRMIAHIQAFLEHRYMIGFLILSFFAWFIIRNLYSL